MTASLWAQLVQAVDQLITALKQAREEAAKWRARALELEALHAGSQRKEKIEDQAKDRELERLRKEKKKTLVTLEVLSKQLDDVSRRLVNQEEADSHG